MGFRNPIVAGIKLIREAIQSPDYQTGVQGWTVNQDGTAEFQQIIARGALQVDSLVSGTPGAARTEVTPTDFIQEYDASNDLRAVLSPDGLTVSNPTTNGEVAINAASVNIAMFPGNPNPGQLEGTIEATTGGGLSIMGFSSPTVGGGSPSSLLLIDDPTATGQRETQLLTDRLTLIGDLYLGTIEKAWITVFEDSAQSSVILPLTNVPAAVPGCTLNYTTQRVGAKYKVTAVADMQMLATVNNTGIGELTVDGVVQSGQIVFAGQTNGVRGTVSQTWCGTLPAAGNHVFVLRGSCTGAALQLRMLTPHTTLTVEIKE